LTHRNDYCTRYYQGIGAAVAVIAAWQLADVACFLMPSLAKTPFAKAD